MAETATTDKTKTTRDRVYLKSGMGSVAAEDYDEKIHGKALELTDDEYNRRLGITAAAPAAAPRTTIAGLHTYDSATQPTPTPVTAPPAPIAAAPVGKPVATTEPDADKAADAKASDTNAAAAKK